MHWVAGYDQISHPALQLLLVVASCRTSHAVHCVLPAACPRVALGPVAASDQQSCSARHRYRAPGRLTSRFLAHSDVCTCACVHACDRV